MRTMADLEKRIEELVSQNAKLEESYDSKHKFNSDDSIKIMESVEKFITTINPKALEITINGKEKKDRYDSNVGDFILKYVQSEQIENKSKQNSILIDQ